MRHVIHAGRDEQIVLSSDETALAVCQPFAFVVDGAVRIDAFGRKAHEVLLKRLEQRPAVDLADAVQYRRARDGQPPRIAVRHAQRANLRAHRRKLRDDVLPFAQRDLVLLHGERGTVQLAALVDDGKQVAVIVAVDIVQPARFAVGHAVGFVEHLPHHAVNRFQRDGPLHLGWLRRFGRTRKAKKTTQQLSQCRHTAAPFS